MGKSIKNLSSVTVVGLDIAKNVFQVHGVDAEGALVVAKPVRRGQLLSFFASLPQCLVGIEACSSAHHWARALIELGHRVKLIPPAYVKPYVRRNKNDAADAAAICEAVGRPNMRFVPVRSVENQAQLMRHRARELLAGNRTRMLNALRGNLAEIGVVAAQGAQHAYALKRLLADGCDENGEVVVPDCVRQALAPLVHQIDAIDAEIDGHRRRDQGAGEGRRDRAAADDDPRRRPDHRAGDRRHGAGDERFFQRQGVRGLPRPDAAPEFERRQGAARAHHQDGRSLLAQALGRGGLRDAHPSQGPSRRVTRLGRSMLARKAVKYKFKLTAVALANKVARIVFALLTRGGQYNELPVAA